jgi:hypothetical protein
MFRLSPLLFLGATSAISLVPSDSARAQLYGRHSGAVDLATVDASALGDTLRSSLGFFMADQWVIAGGVGALGGSLKAYLGSDPNRLGFPYKLGVGYARTIAAHDLAGPLHGAIGAEVVAGFRHGPFGPRDAGALNLTVPVGVSLGDPSGTSLGFYAAPYAESGLTRAWEAVPGSCTPYCSSRLSDTRLSSVAGVGVGGRAAIRRFSLELLLRDVRVHNRRLYAGVEGAVGLAYRLDR